MSSQRIVVIQQAGRGAKKVSALSRRGSDLEITKVIDLPGDLPPIIDDSSEILPPTLDADLVLAFVSHPDLALDLARLCRRLDIPLVASGQKLKVEGTFTPPT